MGFRSLRVLNDDTIAPGRGFGAHGHRDMEIITYVLDGHLRHKDSLGQQEVLGPNEIQAMSAGTGVVHSEFNASSTEPVHLLQVWIVPSADDFEPAYTQFPYAPEEKLGRLRPIAGPSKNGSERIAVINQDAYVYASVVRSGDKINYPLKAGRHAWVQVASGDLSVNGQPLTTGDGLALSDESEVVLTGKSPEGAEILLFDLA
jgi:redox-sensitive bicupin YhaK (pirin superfamily)